MHQQHQQHQQHHPHRTKHPYNPADYLPRGPHDPRYASQAQAAITRAHRRGLVVTAHGHDSTSQRIFCIPSGSHPGEHHWVTQAPGESVLLCDCWANVLCAHVGAVLAYLEHEPMRAERVAAWADIFAEHGYTFAAIADEG